MEKLVCVPDFEAAAFKLLDNNALQYYKSGADDEFTLKDNKEAFKRWIIRPRMLRDVSQRTITTTVLGKSVAFPIGVSPTAMQKLSHPEGECANARAAAEMGTIYILSTISTSSLEEVAAAAPNGRRWFQLYVFKDRNVSTDLIRRAEAAGYEALVLTVDAPLFGKRRSNIRDNFHLPNHLRLANFDIGSTNSNALNIRKDFVSAMTHIDALMDQSLTWEDVKWLKRVTRLPIIVKGILTAEDAEIAIQYGVSGVFVSNHGARQLDTVLSSIDALPEIVKQVAGRCEVYLDGGVSTGSDAFKAIALGAKMAFLGRPLLWGLTLGGQAGAKKVLQIMKDEFDLTMALSGAATVDKITEDFLFRQLTSRL